MKNLKIYSIILAVLLMLGSCESWIDSEVNVDPNNPSDVPVSLLLPDIQGFWAYQMGGDMTLASRLWMQQLSGEDRQGLTIDRYTYNEGDVGNIWRFSSYAASFIDTKLLMDKAEEEGAPAYLGIAQVWWVYQFINLTDVFGDVPYSEAFKGLDNEKPVFDSQESIFNDLDSKLTAAINNLSADPGLIVPGEDDLIYGGDLSLWLKAAYAARAKLYLRWGERDNARLGQIQAAIDNSFESSDEDLVFTFSTAANNSNPLYQFAVVDRPGYIAIGEYYMNLMNGGTPDDFSDDDPRLAVVAIPLNDSVYLGSVVGEPSGGVASDLGPYLTDPTAEVVFASYAELKFIEAELNAGTAAGVTALQEAVAASLERFGVAGNDPAWEAANITGIASATLEEVMLAKYLGLAFQAEVYADYRRTGYPVLATYNNLPVPRRYPYSTASSNYNGDNVPDATKSTPVWWDVD